MMVTHLIIALFSVFFYFGQHVEAGSGYLMDPPARSYLWRLPEYNGVAPINYNDMSIDCGSGGAEWTQYNAVNQGRCGPCGDEWSLPQPRPNEEGGQYGLGIIGKTYKAESVVNMTVKLQAGMYGYFEFHLCAYKKSAKELVTQECFDRHLLRLMDGSIRYPIPAQADNTVHTVSLKLPDGNVNCEHCVIRWRYLAGNPSCQDGENGSGCGQQSELRNCADVTIEPLESRGYILDPPSRSVIGQVSDYDSLDCGGQWAQYNDLNEGKCGECGDEWRVERPRPNEEGGVNKLGATIEQKYTAGDVVNMTVLVTEDYGGYFEFRLCADKAEAEQLITQECLDRHLLKLADGSTRYHVPDKIANTYHNVTLQLPKGDVDCKNCVIQWLYRTGHKAWGTCEDGTFAMGCGDEQQEIRNCADIKIVQPPLTETAKGLLFMQTQYLGN